MNNDFLSTLQGYQQQIDAEIGVVCERFLSTTKDTYGSHAALAVEAYCSLLKRGGKRIRGALTMHGYALAGGKDVAAILQAACAVEMVHAYILVIDDIQDRSAQRRGGATVHKYIEQKAVANGWRGDYAHTGVSLALNAALIGAHYAQNILASLPVSEDLRLKALHMMNETMIITAHGQTGDIINEVNGAVTAADIDEVINRKTAHYTLLGPLQLGMLLAGASQADLRHVEPYALAVGRVFQVTDDMFTYTSDATDKDMKSDVREGKMTLLVHYALENSEDTDAVVMQKLLGKQDLTDDEFEEFRSLVVKSGALDFAHQQAADAYQTARTGVEAFPSSWPKSEVDFLVQLAGYIVNRKS